MAFEKGEAKRVCERSAQRERERVGDEHLRPLSCRKRDPCVGVPLVLLCGVLRPPFSWQPSVRLWPNLGISVQRIQVGDYDRAGGHSVTIDLCLLDAIPADNGGGRVQPERLLYRPLEERDGRKVVRLELPSSTALRQHRVDLLLDLPLQPRVLFLGELIERPRHRARRRVRPRKEESDELIANQFKGEPLVTRLLIHLKNFT
mmetsp:Transcript_5777/g.14027  ORF Transcript_5777/g.14027 Transcript_5777/m.14027 type:complete len:203 (+) Transcript_5777:1358-1966(+)